MKVRKRLTILYSSVLAGLFFLFALGLYFSFTYHLRAEVDESLSSWSLQILDSDGKGRLLIPVPGGPSPDRDSRHFEMPDTFVVAFANDGALLLNRSSFSEHGLDVLRTGLETDSASSSQVFRNQRIEGQGYRVLMKEVTHEAGDIAAVVLGRSLIHVEKSAKGLLLSLVFAWVAAVLFGSTVMWILVGQTIKPVHAMTNLSLSIAQSSDLRGRLSVGEDQDEFSELARSLNRMLATIEASNEAQKQFLADASHQLRTPLTSIRANLGYLMKATGASEADRRAALEDCSYEIEGMSTLVNELLLLARTEAPIARHVGPVEVKDLIMSIPAGLGGKTGPTTSIAALPESASILGDKEELRQALLMLVDNSIKYSGAGGRIEIRGEVSGGKVDILIEDDGPGIPAAEMVLVFERFYRASNTRSSAPGSGLGLPIVKSIVQKNGGSISIANRSPSGLSVRLSFPAFS
ncbi:MAG: HAMP domain-containing sensor histidine kinase [Spirochaetota bacterium]